MLANKTHAVENIDERPEKNPCSSIDQSSCFHCGEELSASKKYVACISGVEQAMCCIGCKTIAEMIDYQGLHQFYTRRTLDSDKKNANEYLDFLRKQAPFEKTVTNRDWTTYNSEEIYNQFVSNRTDKKNTLSEVNLYLNNIYCHSCSWLIEKSLKRLDGVCEVYVNIVDKSASVIWLDNQVKLSDILSTLNSFGYTPELSERNILNHRKDERKNALKRLGVAGFGMMQVMSYSFGLYLGEFQSIDTQIERFFVLISMFITTLVVVYSGKPFLNNALRDIQHRILGMDVPISLAIVSAYSLSVYAVFFDHQRSIYFDSVVMFVFFLSVSRYIELIIRHRSLDQQNSISALIPSTVTCIKNNEHVSIPSKNLTIGDKILVQKNNILPIDAIISPLNTNDQEQICVFVDESAITGESSAVKKKLGDTIYAGSRNLSNESILEVKKTLNNSTLATIKSLVQKSLFRNNESISKSVQSNILSQNFILTTLVVAFITGCAWLFINPDRVFEVVLSVLVVTCPCALSLALPSAQIRTINILLKYGVLLANANCLNKVNICKHWVFDKTGTLTKYQHQLKFVQLMADMNEKDVLAIAFHLEEKSHHPLARVFESSRLQSKFNIIESFDMWQEIPGKGVKANITFSHSSSSHMNGEYRLGSFEWIKNWTKLNTDNLSTNNLTANNDNTCYLANKERLLAVFSIKSCTRDNVISVLKNIVNQGKSISILSGDRQSKVNDLVSEINSNGAFIAQALGDQSPEQKIAYAKSIQNQDKDLLMMFGDGINDAPVLSTADVSVGMGEGANIAHSVSDIILLNNQLSSIFLVQKIAHVYEKISKQNTLWAIVYNITMLPLAISGLLSPWMAALGMSLSSLIVVCNSLRIHFDQPDLYMKTKPV